MSDEQKRDQELEKLLKEKGLGSEPWLGRKILGVEKIKNPYFDQSLRNYSEKSSLGSHPAVKLLNTDCLIYKVNPVILGMPDEFQGEREFVFKSEIGSKEKLPPIRKESTAMGASVTFHGENFDCFNIQVGKVENLRNLCFLRVKIDDLKFEFQNIEPVLCSMFLMDSENGKIISERYNFYTESIKIFFNEDESKDEAYIEITGYENKAILVVEFFRVLQTGNGDSCNMYMKKGDSSLQKANNVVKASWPELKNVYSPFAFTFTQIDYKSLKDNMTNIKFSSPLLIDKPLTPDYIFQQIGKGNKSKLESLPITLTIRALAEIVSKVNEMPKDIPKFRNLEPLNNCPLLEYSHKLILNLDQVKFDLPSKVNAHNILAVVSLYKEGKPLKAVHGKWGQDDLVEECYSRCYYHEKAPVFDDEFIIDLPYPVTPDTQIVIKYFHVSTQEKDEKMTIFAVTTIPLIENDIFICDGTKNIGIGYNTSILQNQKPTQNNFQTIRTTLKSILTTNFQEAKCLFKEDSSSLDVTLLPDDLLIQNMYLILDAIFKNIEIETQKMMNNLFYIGKLSSLLSSKCFESLLNTYASLYAFRELSNKLNVHNIILQYWTEYIGKFDSDNQSQRNDIYLSSFLFSLIIKSMIISKDTNFSDNFNAFSEKMDMSIQFLIKDSVHNAKTLVKSYAEFISLISTFGFYETIGKAMISFSFILSSIGTNDSNELALEFFEKSLSPKLFSVLSLNKTLVSFLVAMVKRVIDLKSNLMKSIFRILCRLLVMIPKQTRTDIANSYLEIAGIFNSKINQTQDNLIMSLSFVIFILRNVSSNEFMKFFKTKHNDEFFDFLHFMLEKLKISNKTKIEIPKSSEAPVGSLISNNFLKTAVSKVPSRFKESLFDADKLHEIVTDTELSIIHIMEIIADNCANRKYIENVIEVIYHILSLDISIDAIIPLKKLLYLMVEKHIHVLYEYPRPPFTLFVKKILSLAAVHHQEVSSSMIDFIQHLFEVELKHYKTNNRSLVCIVRAISKMNDEDVESEYLHNSLKGSKELAPIYEVVTKLTELNNDMRSIDPKHYQLMRKENTVEAATDQTTIIEKYGDDILARSRVLKLSPDAAAEEIQILSQYHWKNGYSSEALMCQIYQIAMIIEYLTILGKIPNAYNLEHPAMAFESLLTDVKNVICDEQLIQDLPNIDTFCDSSSFSEAGVNCVLQDIFTFCKQSRYFELSHEIARVIYPLFERHQMFSQLGRFFQQEEMSYQVVANMSSSVDRLFGRYYKVSFYGKIFGDEDGKTYIYREIKLAHIFDVSSRIAESYKKLYGQDKIELLQNSGTIDRTLLNENKGYIQITFVEPYFEKKELPSRVTVYEQGNKIQKFKFEAPFVKGGHKAQGTVDIQWLRRTILKVDSFMPSITKRVEVPSTGVIVIEYEPIRVSIRQLKERLSAYKEALETKNATAIQPLLHGSLLTSVNEGPVVMAEKFLNTPLRTKYTESMRKQFKLFLEYNHQGLLLHSQMAKENPTFAPLQQQLEEGFKHLSEKLNPYLENI